MKVALLLAIMPFCLFGFVLNRQSNTFCESEAALLSLQWMLLACLAVWCGTLIFLTFSRNDWPLISLLLIAITAYFIGYATQSVDAIILLAGVTLGKFAFVLLRRDEGGAKAILWLKAKGEMPKEDQFRTQNLEFSIFLVGLVLLLTFSSWWHLYAMGAYHGPRWMGLWNNPNDYGLLMGAGFILAAGLLAARSWKMEDGETARSQKSEVRSQNQAKRGEIVLRIFAAIKYALFTPHSAILLVAAGMMGVGLLFSFSRGAWVGAAIGSLYLAKNYCKFKWRWFLPPVLVAVAVVCLFWHNTPDNARWFIKRLDLSRASAQHRVAAWKAGFEIIRDHPFGVGWNKAVQNYEKNYSPPEGGATAITTNDYLMLGTQLGILGPICFVAYVGLCLRTPRSKFRSLQSVVHSPQSLEKAEVFSKAEIGNQKEEMTRDSGPWTLDSRLRVACRAGALVFLVAFWFDGGLFKLATASVFWILLELGAERQKLKTTTLKAKTDQPEVETTQKSVVVSQQPELLLALFAFCRGTKLKGE